MATGGKLGLAAFDAPQDRREEWAWVFDSLYRAVKHDTAPASVCVPDTVLFNRGQPNKWIGTDEEGHLVNKYFPPMNPTEDSASMVQHRLRAIRFAFFQFRRFPTSQADRAVAPLCTVVYQDGKMQVLDVQTFDQLSGHALWLVQVMALQAYVVTDVLYRATYTPERGVKVAEGTGPGLEPVVMELVESIHTTYTTRHFHAKEAYGQPRVRPRLLVLRCKAVFKRDMDGKLWLTHCEELATRRTESEKPVFRRDRAAEKWADAEVKAAADGAERELRQLLRHALERGISLKESFKHFDVAGIGVIHPKDFATGLKLLNIDLHPAAAHALAARIPVNRVSLIGPEQFIIWCETGDNPVYDAPQQRPPKAESRRRSRRSGNRRPGSASDRAGSGAGAGVGTPSTSLTRSHLSAPSLHAGATSRNTDHAVPSSRPGSVGNVRELARQELQESMADTLPVRHFGTATWVGEDADGLGGTTADGAPLTVMNTTAAGATSKSLPPTRAKHSDRRRRRGRKGKRLTVKKAREKLQGVPPGWVGFRETWVSNQGSLLDFEEDYKLDKSSSSSDGGGDGRLLKLPKWARPSTKKALEMVRDAKRRRAMAADEAGGTTSTKPKGGAKSRRRKGGASRAGGDAEGSATARSRFDSVGAGTPRAVEAVRGSGRGATASGDSAGMATGGGSSGGGLRESKEEKGGPRDGVIPPPSPLRPRSPLRLTGNVRFADEGDQSSTGRPKTPLTPTFRGTRAASPGEGKEGGGRYVGGTGRPLSRSALRSPPVSSGAIKFDLAGLQTMSGVSAASITDGGRSAMGGDDGVETTPRGGRVVWVSNDAAITYRLQCGPPLPVPPSHPPSTPVPGTLLLAQDAQPGYPFLSGQAQQPGSPPRREAPGTPGQASAFGFDDGDIAASQARRATSPLAPAAVPQRRGAPPSAGRGVGVSGGDDKGRVSTPVGRAAAQAAAQNRGLQLDDVLRLYRHGRPVDVLVLPGLFDTQSDLMELLHPLTQVLNGTRFLYPTFPGQPGTTWDDTKAFTNEYLANCVQSLIDQKVQAGEWGDGGLPGAMARDILIVGFGIGANVGVVLATKLWQGPDRGHLGEALRGMVLFNAFTHMTDALSKCLKRIARLHKQEGKQAQRRTKAGSKRRGKRGAKARTGRSKSPARRKRGGRGASRGSSAGSDAEAEAARSETLLHLTSLLFSPAYLNKVTRAEAVAMYKYHHQDIVVGKPSADLGVAQLAHGIRCSDSVREQLASLSVPVVLLCATENTFVLPANTRQIESDRRRKEANPSSRVTTLEDIVSAPRDVLLTHVMYLRSGHLISQERRDFIVKLVEQFIVGRLDTAVPRPPPAKEQEPLEPFADQLARVPAGIYWGKKKEKRQVKPKRDTSLMGLLNAGYGGAVHVGGANARDTEAVKEELTKRGLSTEGSPYELVNRLDAALEAERLEAAARIAASKAENRTKAAAQKARRIANAKAARHAHRREMNRIRNQSEAEVLRAAQHTAMERENQRREAALMAAEDELVKLHRRYVAKVARQEHAARVAKKAVVELQVHRMNDQEEDRMRTQDESRAAVREEKRKKAEELREKIANESVELPGDRLGYGFDTEEFQPLAEGVERLLDDVSEMRIRQDRAVTRWRRLDTRLKQLTAEKHTLEQELANLERAIASSMREANAMLKYGGGDDMDDAVIEAAKAEQEELREKREEVIPILDAVRAHLTLSLGEMDGVNRNVQRISLAAKKKEEQLQAMRMKLARMIVSRREMRRRRLVDQERCVREVGETELAIQSGRKRLKELRKEYARVKKVKKKYCTTRVWQRNVTQHIRTAELRKFLRKDIKVLAKTLAKSEASLADKGVAAEKAGVDAADAEKGVARLKKNLKSIVLLQKAWEEANNQNLSEGSSREIALRWNHMFTRHLAEMTQAVADIEEQGGIIHELGAEFTDHTQTHVTEESRARLLVRWKPANERTQDEKEWVACDKVMFPQYYQHLSDIDEQCYLEDPAYRPPMRKEALLRLFHLPRPHMSGLGLVRSQLEFRCYDLIQTYSHGVGWEMLRLRDQQSGAITAGEAAMTRGWVARMKTPEQRSLEEAEWVSIDRVLRPELYALEEKREAAAAARREKERRLRAAPVDLGHTLPSGEGKGSEGDGDDVDAASVLTGQVTMADVRKDAKAHFKFLMERKKAKAQRKVLAQQKKAEARRMARDPNPLKYWVWLGGTRGHGDLHSARSASSLKSGFSRASLMSNVSSLHSFHSEYDAMPTFKCEMNQFQLRRLLNTKPISVRSDRKRRVQMLMRAYGSDDGAAVRANAEAVVTPVVRNIHAFPDTLTGIAEDLRQRQEVSLSKEIAFGSVAAAAVTASQGVVMLHSDAVEPLLSVAEHTLERGETHEHAFEIPAGLNLSNIHVQITYRGDFDGRGFVVGRLACGMFRMPLADPGVIAQAHQTVDLSMLAQGAAAATLSGAVGDGAPGLGAAPRGPPVDPSNPNAATMDRRRTGWDDPAASGNGNGNGNGNGGDGDGDDGQADFGGIVPGGAPVVHQLRRLPGLPGYSDATPAPDPDAGQKPMSIRRRPPTLELPKDMVAALRRVPVGYPVVDQCVMNTDKTMGRTVFRHEPLHLPVMPARYVIQLTSLARTHYSISVVGQRVYTAEQAIEAAVKNAIHAKGRIPECRVELEDLNLALRLGKWKFRLVQDLIATTEAHLKATSHVLTRLRKALEKGEVVRKDLGPLGSDTTTSEEEHTDSDDEDDSSEEDSTEESSEESDSSDWDSSTEESDSEDSETMEDRLKRRARRKVEVTEQVHHRIVERIAKLEEDYAGIVQSLRTRKQELDDIQTGLNQMLKNKKLREAEIEELELTLNKYKQQIPFVVTALRGESDAELRKRKKAEILDKLGISHKDLRQELVTSLAGEQLTQKELDINRFGKRVVDWLEEQRQSRMKTAANTPGEKVRRKVLDDLTVEEREWMSMDRVLHPDRYRGDDDEFNDAMDKETAALLAAEDAKQLGVKVGVSSGKEGDAAVAKRGKVGAAAGVTTSSGKGDADLRSFRGSVSTIATNPGAGAGVGAGAGARPTQVSIAEEILGAAGVDSSGNAGKSKRKHVQAGMPGSKESKATVGKTKWDTYLPNCTYTKEELVRIRDSPIMDLTAEEVPVRKLLSKFHDRPARPHDDYDPWADSGSDNSEGDDPVTGKPVQKWTRDFGDTPLQPGRKVRDMLMDEKERFRKQRELAASKKQGIINFKAEGSVISRDVDKRCKQVLGELDRAYASRKKFMDSAILHNTQQRFPVTVLRTELERELDRLLLGQVFEREHIQRQDYNTRVLKLRHHLKKETPEQEEERKRKEEAARKFLADRAAVAITTTKTYGPKAKATVRRAQMAAAAARAARAFGDQEDSDEEEQDDPVRLLGDVIKWGATRKPLALENKVKHEVAGNNGAGARRRREALARAKMREARALGPGGCLACQTAPCSWKPHIEVAKRTHRLRIVERELDRIERLPEGTKFLVTEVPLSVQRGGANRLPVRDFKEELLFELAVLKRDIRLHEVDEELHRAYCSHSDYLETHVLHGYPQMNWRKDAIVALEREATKHIARNVAVDIVDDILDWMLEGWHFGERQSELPIAGFVPSLQPDRPLRPAESRTAEAAELAATGKSVDFMERFQEGKLPRVYAEDQWAPIDAKARQRGFVTKAVQAGSAVEANMDETERTLKFGLFMMSLMYFRSMNQLRVQRDMWGGEKHDAMAGRGGQNATKERRKMEEAKRNRDKRQRAIQRAYSKADAALSRREKLAQEEHQAARRKLFQKVRRRKLEEAAASKVQSAYRGHLARIAVKKWSLKRRELDAIRALRLAAAINIQRIWRGYVGRLFVADKQKEMAAFIKMIREQEEQELQEDFYATNTLERWKRDWRRWRGKEKVFDDPEKAFVEAKYEADSEESDESGGSDTDEAETDSDANSDDEGAGDDGDGEDAGSGSHAGSGSADEEEGSGGGSGDEGSNDGSHDGGSGGESDDGGENKGTEGGGSDDGSHNDSGDDDDDDDDDDDEDDDDDNDDDDDDDDDGDGSDSDGTEAKGKEGK